MIAPIEIPDSLQTDRTVLKKYRVGDGRLFFELIENNRRRLFHSFPIIISTVTNEVNAELFIRSRLNEWTEQQSFTFAVWNQEETNLIGHFSIKNIDWTIPRAELAYFLSYEFEGKGIMTEVLTKIISLCFLELGMNKLFVRVITSNDKSYKVAEKCGFIREGIIRKDYRASDGELVDLYYYGLTREDFENYMS